MSHKNDDKQEFREETENFLWRVFEKTRDVLRVKTVPSDSAGVASGGAGSASGGVNNALNLGSKIDGTVDTVVLCVRPIGGSSNVDVEGALTWQEIV